MGAAHREPQEWQEDSRNCRLSIQHPGRATQRGIPKKMGVYEHKGPLYNTPQIVGFHYHKDSNRVRLVT